MIQPTEREGEYIGTGTASVYPQFSTTPINGERSDGPAACTRNKASRSRSDFSAVKGYSTLEKRSHTRRETGLHSDTNEANRDESSSSRSTVTKSPSSRDPPEADAQLVDPPEGGASEVDPPGRYAASLSDPRPCDTDGRGSEGDESGNARILSTAATEKRGLEPTASINNVESSKFAGSNFARRPTTIHTEDSRRSGKVLRGIDPPTDDGDGQRNVLTIKQSSHDRNRSRLWLIIAGLGFALLLASGWCIGLALLVPLIRNSNQQHLILPPSLLSPGGNAAETQHVVLTMLFIAGGNVSRDADNELPSSILSFQDVRTIASGALSSQADTPVSHDDDANKSPNETIEVQDADKSPNEIIEVQDADKSPKEIIEFEDADESPKEHDADKSQKETNVAVRQDADADGSPMKIEVEDDLPMLPSPSSLRNNAKPTNNDDALCDETSSKPVDRVSEGDERVVKHITAYTADRSLLPTSSTTIDNSSAFGLDSEPERDENISSSDSDGVYVPEGEVYYTTNGDRLADDSQLQFGFVRTYGGSALHDLADYLTFNLEIAMTCNRDWLVPYFGSLKG